MSTNLYWRPIPKGDNLLPDGLKWALQKRYDGFVSTRMNRGDIEYLKGLSDADVEGADELIAAIEDHDEVEVKEER